MTLPQSNSQLHLRNKVIILGLCKEDRDSNKVSTERTCLISNLAHVQIEKLCGDWLVWFRAGVSGPWFVWGLPCASAPVCGQAHRCRL